MTTGCVARYRALSACSEEARAADGAPSRGTITVPEGPYGGHEAAAVGVLRAASLCRLQT